MKKMFVLTVFFSFLFFSCENDNFLQGNEEKVKINSSADGSSELNKDGYNSTTMAAGPHLTLVSLGTTSHTFDISPMIGRNRPTSNLSSNFTTFRSYYWVSGNQYLGWNTQFSLYFNSGLIPDSNIDEYIITPRSSKCVDVERLHLKFSKDVQTPINPLAGTQEHACVTYNPSTRKFNIIQQGAHVLISKSFFNPCIQDLPLEEF